ncbi:MAG: hypothetical protein Q9201_006964 [Fulgogasparrea decipioides]
MSANHSASTFKGSRMGRLNEQLGRLSKKRKRGFQNPEELRLNLLATVHSETPPTDPLSQAVAEQYRTAGHSAGNALYPYPFPHASIRRHAQADSPSTVGERSPNSTPEHLFNEFSESDHDVHQAVFTPKFASNSGLRQQHYNVLTSLLHRCILERDYVRASRAWGILLRIEVQGHPLDVRVQERWGIGAELLLHSNGNRDSQLTLENLTRAKDYYERLILQYPYRKNAPDATSSLQFYPVMFGIWIYSIQLHHRVAMQRTTHSRQSRPSVDSNDNFNSNDGDENLSTTSIQISGRILGRKTAVQHAEEVAERLGELLISPPFSDHPGLWRIQGMLFVWISQLLCHTSEIDTERRSTTPFSQVLSNSEDESSSSSGFQSSDPNAQSLMPQGEPKTAKRMEGKRQEAIAKAKEALSRAVDLGCTLDTSILQEVGL